MFGAQDVASVHYLYDTCHATGAGRRVYWVDGTMSQSWNRIMWKHCLDCCNPESPTFSTGPAVPLYGRVGMYRNPVGHTFMGPDATHGVVCRRGANLSHVSSTKEWSGEVCAKARAGAEAIHSTFMDKSYFRQWKPYLSQMYRVNPKSTEGNTYKVLGYYWANFGWGKLPDGTLMWLYTYKGEVTDEWHKETPVKVVFARNMNQDGSQPNVPMQIVP
jgi:hypothetical protein